MSSKFEKMLYGRWYLLFFLMSIPPLSYAQDTSDVAPINILPSPVSYRTLYLPSVYDYRLSRRYLIQEANKGDAQAQHELGLRYLFGFGFDADTAQGVAWLKKAADARLPIALYNYGIMLNTGIGVEWNPFEAFRYFQFAADSLLSQAQYALGIIYRANLIVPRQEKIAIYYLTQAARQDFEPAHAALDEWRRKEPGLFINFSLDDSQSATSMIDTVFNSQPEIALIDGGFEWDFIEFNADSGLGYNERTILEPLFNKNEDELGQILGARTTLAAKDEGDSAKLDIILQVARAGSPEALLMMGMFHQYGYKVKKNLIHAVHYYLRAWRLGSFKAWEFLNQMSQDSNLVPALDQAIRRKNPEAMFDRAGMTAIGLDMSLSSAQAWSLLITAADQKFISAVLEAGICFYSGILVDKDRQRALEYWNLASELGDSEGDVRIDMATLSDTLFQGNKQSSLSRLNQAVENGSVLAQLALGDCYKHGWGVKRNWGQAAAWYQQAGMRGNMAAFQSYKNMLDSLRPPYSEFQIR